MAGGLFSAGDRPRARVRAARWWLGLPLAALTVAMMVARPGGAAEPAVGIDASIAVTAPRPAAFVRGVVHIEAVAGLDVDAVTFEVSRDGGASWSVAATDQTLEDGFTGTWDTRPWSGEASIRAVADSGASPRVAVHVDNALPAASIHVTRRFVNAVDPPVHGTVDASEPLSVRVRVVGPRRPPIRVPVAATLGRLFTFAWTPSSHGKCLPDGVYRLVASLRDRAGNRAEVEAQVVIDTNPPRVSELTGRVDGGGRRLVVRFVSSDSTGVVSARARVRYVNGGAELPGTRLVQDTASQWHVPLRTPLLPGAYAIRLSVRDGAGNAATREQRLLVRRAVRTQVVSRVLGVGRRVALTFDDCNSGAVWRDILRTLGQEHVHAAFFCAGSAVRVHPGQAARTLQAGHVVGSHAWSHVNVARLTQAAVRSRLEADTAVWWRTFRASATPYFRPPYGLFTRSTLQAVGAAGYAATVLWDVDPWDWSSPGAGAIASRVVGHTRPGSIILLHVVPQTADALPSIIAGLRDRGLEPVGLDELVWAPSAVRIAGGWAR